MRSGRTQSTLEINKILAENQATNTVVMISPDAFNYNIETAETNAFQIKDTLATDMTEKALSEFESMVDLLRSHHINVLVLSSRTDISTPDAVFPNNWFSSHTTAQGRDVLVLYPMMAKNRRDERQFNALEMLLNKHGVKIDHVVDLTALEEQGCFLEGTGSMILDHINKIAYAALSPRTNLSAVNQFCKTMGYKPITFQSHDESNKPIYHTNVVMSIGTEFAVLAVDTIHDANERDTVMTSLIQTNKQIITITYDQMKNMAGNILEVKSTDGHSHIVMSQTAFNAFTIEQKRTINQFGEPIVVQINTIEKFGGGSARCMLAEIFSHNLNKNSVNNVGQPLAKTHKLGF